MPVAKIHVTEGQYDEPRLERVSGAVQDSLRRILKIPPDDFYQIIHVLPKNRFLHTPSFLGLKYSDETDTVKSLKNAADRLRKTSKYEPLSSN